jgi:hypothetical protein
VKTPKLIENLTDLIISRDRQYLDTVLEAVKFPARIADLDTGLTDVDRNALPHFWLEISNEGIERMEEGES